MPNSLLPAFKPVNAAHFREAMSRFATGVTVITARHHSRPVGVTISSFAGVSLEPPLVLFCLDEKSSALPAFKKGAAFAVHVLAENQQTLAQLFARAGARDWNKVKLKKHPCGVPVLEGVMQAVLCRVDKKIRAGDHSIILGRVREILIDPRRAAPLLHTQRGYWQLGKQA